MALTLRDNEIFKALSNMIIGQFVFTDNIAGNYDSLVNRARIDGSLYGDTYLYYATDASKSYAFRPDEPQQLNVLDSNRPKAPVEQAIVLNNFRQIAMTIDSYFSKRAFTTEGAFAQFNSTVLQWLRDTKAIIDSTEYNAFIGTATSAIGKQTQTVVIPEGTGEEGNRLFAQAIAEKVANILTELKDVNKDYNDLGFYRSYNPDDLIVVWNADFYNKILKTDLPTIFHKDGLIDKFDAKNVLPAKYFGTPTDSVGAGTRALKELEYELNGKTIHVFAGEEVPTGATVDPAYDDALYTADDSIVCKIIHKDSVPYMSAFETETMFFNPKNLSENHYLTFGRNTLAYLKQYPMITVKVSE